MSEPSSSAPAVNPRDGFHRGMGLQLDGNGFLESPSSSPDSVRSLSSLDVEFQDGVKTVSSEDDSGIQSPDCRPDDNDNSVSVYSDANEDTWYADCDDRDNVTLILDQTRDLDNDFSKADLNGKAATSGQSSAADAPLVSSEDEEGGDEEEDSFMSLCSVLGESEEIQVVGLSRKPIDNLGSKLHQEALQGSMGFQDQEIEVPSSSRRADIALQIHQGGLPESVDLLNGKAQIPKTTGNFLGAQQETKYPSSEEDQTWVSTRRLIMTHNENEIHQQCLQESMESDVEFESETLQESMKSPTEAGKMWGSIEKHDEGPVQEVLHSTEIMPTQQLAEITPGEAELVPVPEGPLHFTAVRNSESLCLKKENRKVSQNAKEDPNQLLSRLLPKPWMVQSTKMDGKRFPRRDLKHVKPEVVSRAASAPRLGTPDTGRSAVSCEIKPLSARGRATRRIQQGEDGGNKSLSYSSQARANATASPDAKPKSTEAQRAKGTTQSISEEHLGPEIFTNGHQGRNGRSRVGEVTGVDGSGWKVDVEVGVTPRDAEQGPDLLLRKFSSNPGPQMVAPRLPNRAFPFRGLRVAPAAGVSKKKVIDSSVKVFDPAPQKPASRLPIKTGSLPTSLSSSSVGSAASETVISKGAALVMKCDEPIVRTSLSSQGKAAGTKPTAATRNRSNTATKANTAAHTSQPKNTQNALRRGASARPGRTLATVCPSSRGGRSVQAAHTHADKDDDKKNNVILQLRRLVAQGNRRLEALSVLIQHILQEREEALKQKKDISIQLKSLREELSHSAACCERLESERASACRRLDAAVLKLQEQHQAELVQLEDSLREFYSAEWDKAHQAYQDEADRCRDYMRQQVEEVRRQQEVLRREQEVVHAKQMEVLRQEFETSLTDLQKDHEQYKQELDNKLIQSEAVHNEKIETLTVQNKNLRTRLSEEEEKRKTLADKSQRDSRVVYLEQELESLKVVLELKTDQMHQQDKKLMQLDKLMENNVKLEECLTKLRQENEDYRERMDKHAALSRQLSTEQAMLQKTLQNESKANKRLSMENEELLWKLHNGLSPRNSASFPSSPVSPR